MKKNKKVTMKSILWFLLLIVSIILIVSPFVKNYILTSNLNKNQITKITKEQIEENKTKEVSYNWDEVQALDANSVINLKDSNADLPVIGGITIPELEMNLPIFNGVSNESLSFGSGTLTENQVMGQGNYSLASHHIFGIANANKLLFSPLDNAKKGQKIYITDKSKVYQYNITDVYVVSPDRIDVLNKVPGKKIITLITCTDFNATNRIIVQGELISEYNYNTMPEEAKVGFQMEYQTLSI